MLNIQGRQYNKAHPLYEPEYIIPSVGNLAEGKPCVSRPEFSASAGIPKYCDMSTLCWITQQRVAR
jgi:hypothetical protein